MKKIKQFAMKKIADDYILIPRYETAEEMSDVIPSAKLPPISISWWINVRQLPN